MKRPLTLFLLSLLAGCQSTAVRAFDTAVIAEFDEGWAMSFLPDGRLLVTEKPGRLLIVTQDGVKSAPVSGIPAVDYGGQGGLGGVILHPDFSRNGLIYISYAEAGSGDLRGAAVARGRLILDATGSRLEEVEVIWRQVPKVSGRGHYGHRLAFSPDGYLFVSSGDRQKFTPAQDLQQNLGKILRLHEDGTVPDDNPFVDEGGIAAEVWSIGRINAVFRKGQRFLRRWRWERATLHCPSSRSVRSSPVAIGSSDSAMPAPFQAGGLPVPCRLPPGNRIRG